MGSFFSKKSETKFTPDYSEATFSADALKRQTQRAAELATKAAGSTYQPLLYILGGCVVILILIFVYDALASQFGWATLLLPAPTQAVSGSDPDITKILYIDNAWYGTSSTQSIPVTSQIKAMISSDKITIPPFTVGYKNLGQENDPYPGKLNSLQVSYSIGNGAQQTTTVKDGDQFGLPVSPDNSAPLSNPTGNDKGVEAPSPPLLRKIYNSFFGGSSGDLAPSFHDASTTTSIKGNLAPLSAERDGGYGMQWWMYVKDWNYGYGKKKSVLKRSSGSNRSIMNPDIYLHPTDNALEVSVSVYPATEGGSGKATPAPAGHSGSSDDVFVCSVPNIPLQTWFSVSVTVFGRNMDIYIDGKLVKSCFLSGVPKPAVGNIDLTPDGGFSGRICNFYHYPKMLTPSDAMTFWSAGTPCRSQTATGGSNATGYSVKFGVYDAVGKQVQEYAF